MRSSSLKVYSPVEYTGYKEKRSGHPSEPGSRTGNRKTTRKPKPILYRLRRFCKRLNWKGIGGLAVTTMVIVFAVRGVVGMFSEHTQTKTAPITTSSPAAEESQPYVFYYKDGQIRYTQSGTAVASFDLAVQVPSKNKDAAPDYIPIVCWRERAEFCGRYLSKGRQIVVEGRISTRKWKDEKTGQNRKAVEVVASNIYFADSNGGNANGNPQPANNDGFMDIPDDGQLPFN